MGDAVIVGPCIPFTERQKSPIDISFDTPGSHACICDLLPSLHAHSAGQVSIYQLLDSDEMKFDVPVYQRPYSWQTKQVYEMLQDFYKVRSPSGSRSSNGEGKDKSRPSLNCVHS